MEVGKHGEASVHFGRLALGAVAIRGSVNMASPDDYDVSEVELQPDMQEIEIETIPVEIPCETVETTIECVDGQPMIALQGLSEREEIILQTGAEEIGDPLSVYETIPNELYVQASPGPSSSKRLGKRAKKETRFRSTADPFGDLPETKTRKWEQKQVQIRTLEGEFSVTMWASGTDDGESTIDRRRADRRDIPPRRLLFIVCFDVVVCVPRRLPFVLFCNMATFINVKWPLVRPWWPRL